MAVKDLNYIDEIRFIERYISRGAEEIIINI